MPKRLPIGQKTLVDPEVEAIERLKEDLTEGSNIVFNQVVVCPYCAWGGRVIEFRTKKSELSQSYSNRMFKCPDCGQGMRRDTLLRDMTPSEWARWLYFEVIKYGGFNRISFPKLLVRLREHGWATEFWDAWKAAKEGKERGQSEDYADYLRTSAQESRGKCPHIGKDTGKNTMRCTGCDLHDVCWPKELRE